MASALLGFVSDVAGNVASRIPHRIVPTHGELFQSQSSLRERRQRHVPRGLDMHYITERIVGMAQPAAAAFPTRKDKGRDSDGTRASAAATATVPISTLEENQSQPGDSTKSNDSADAVPLSSQEENFPLPPPPDLSNQGQNSTENSDSAAAMPMSSQEESQSLPSQAELSQEPRRISRREGNCPATLSTFLSRRHSNRFLTVNVSDQDADDRTLLLLNRQVVRFPWMSPCIDKSETPSLAQLFDICYAIHAYLSLDDDRVVLVYCSNGKTRTAIVVACYLKFSGQVQSALDGFRLFCSRRCPDLDPNMICDQIPPSLKHFFRNFNECIELGGYANPKPLLLRAVALQGVPVDDKPCIDIWDSQQNRVYSSHPELWRDPAATSEGEQPADTQWGDEEGFYRVNKVLASDFILLCRFGGPYADDSNDPSKILFRYANSTGFLCSGPYELPKGKVDMMRRYEASFDEDFLLTLMFDSSLDTVASDEYEELCQPCPESLLPRILEGPEAIERGFSIIAERHAARPSTGDVEILTSGEGLADCPQTLTALALQLNNHNLMAAQELLYGGMKDMWVQKADHGAPLEVEALTDIPELSSEDACANVFKILDEVDVGVDMDWIDRVEGDLVDDWETRRQKSKDSGRQIPQSEEPVALYNPLLFPNRGDVVDAFGSCNKQFHYAEREQNFRVGRNPLSFGARPRMPMNSGRKRQRASSDEVSSAKKRHHYDKIEYYSTQGKDAERGLFGLTENQQPPHVRAYKGGIVYDEDTGSAMELLLSLSHTGVTLSDLLSLRSASKEWTGQNYRHRSDHDTGDVIEELKDEQTSLVPVDSEGVSTETSTQLGTPQANGPAVPAAAAAIHVLIRQREALPGLQTTSGDTRPNAQNQLMQGLEVVVERRDVGKDTSGRASSADAAALDVLRRLKESLPGIPVKMSSEIPPTDPPPKRKDLSSRLPSKNKTPAALSKEETSETVKDKAESSSSAVPVDSARPSENADNETDNQGEPEKDGYQPGEDPPLKDDPEYSKYFKMLKMGLPIDAVKHALQRDSKDPTIIELDAEKSLKSQTKPEEKSSDEVPLREDPEYSKYFKMLKMGLPEGAVRNALQRDGKDPGIMDLDPEKSLKSQTDEGDKADNDPPLKDDPDYSKYFKMLKMGLPEGAVRNALQRDGKDPDIMDLDPDKSLKSQKGVGDTADEDPPLKDDPEYSKYFKMLKMGLPDGAVRNALQRDGKDPGIMDLDRDKSLKSQTGGGEKEDDGPPLKDDPEYLKYYKMLKMGLPEGAVRNALARDGKDPGIMDLDPEKSLKSQTGAEDKADDGPPLKDDPEFSKYFKMLKMMLPMGAVKQSMQRDGKDPSIMDLDHNRSLKSQTGAKDDGPPLKDDPEFSKYFKMLKMGLPMGAVKNALQRDGKDTAIMDLDPNKSVASQMNLGKRRKLSKKAKKAVRRKKIYWTPIDEKKVSRDSIWSLVQGTVKMDQLEYDTKEFENLFTESSDPAEKKKKARSGGEQLTKQKKSIQVIDGKRGMNGGIILARLKIEYENLAEMVDKMESDKLDSTQLRALKEFLPTDEERTALSQYMKKGEASEQAMVEAKAALSECEKYMVAMMKVENAGAKFDCMLFKSQFDSRLDELIVARDTVKKACDEVRSSERLRKMMAMILTLVNEINTGGSGKMAVGFSLDALLKLNEAKAFDKKTSVLHYLAKLVLQNDKSLLEFDQDIKAVSEAENVILDALAGDIKTLSQELDDVHKTAKEEADRWEKHVSSEQQAEHQLESSSGSATGRTPMESFTIRADKAVKEAVSSVDDLKIGYAKLLEYFGEDEKMPSDEFFGTIKKFVVEFSSAAEQVDKAEKKKLKDKLRAAAKAAMLASRMSPKNKPKTFDKKSEGENGSKKGIMNGIAAIAAKKQSKEQTAIKSKPDINGSLPQLDNTDGAKREHLDSATKNALKAEAHLKSSEESAKGGVHPLATGIAAAAAAAARKRDDDGNRIVGGIAAAAAAAGDAHSRTRTGSSDHDQRTASPGIAAAAAAAARGRTAKSNSIPASNAADLDDKGTAGAAAATAMARSNSSKDGAKDDVRPVATGIAAAAAAAARKRDDSKNSCVGGIAAAAAAAAEERSRTKGAPSSHDKHPVTPGIAAAAAASARGRTAGSSSVSASKSADLDDKGIAGAAAAAAMARSNVRKDGAKDNVHPVATGIAAAAAAAAQKRDDGKNSRFGGIAAAAAAAAEERFRTKEASSSHDKTPGIAAAAAAAARSRAAESDVSMSDASGPGENEVAGAAAAADAAAKARSKKSGESVEEEVPPAAIDIATDNDSSNVKRPGNADLGVEGVVAAAAGTTEDRSRAKNGEGSATIGIAAARSRNTEQHSASVRGDNEIAETVATAGEARLESREESYQDGARTVAAGITEAASAAAQKRDGDARNAKKPAGLELGMGGIITAAAEAAQVRFRTKDASSSSVLDDKRIAGASTLGSSDKNGVPNDPIGDSRIPQHDDAAALPTTHDAATLPTTLSTKGSQDGGSSASSSAQTTAENLEGKSGDCASMAAVARREEASEAAPAPHTMSGQPEGTSAGAAAAAAEARRGEASEAALAALAMTEQARETSPDDAAEAAARRRHEAAAAASAALASSEKLDEASADGAALATAARRDEAAAAAASAGLATSERSSIDAAAEAAAARQDEALAAACAALGHSELSKEPSKDAAAEAAATRQNEAAAAVAAALAAAREQRESSNKAAMAAAARKNDAASAIAAALAASRQEREASQKTVQQATTIRQNDAASAVAAALAASRKEREACKPADKAAAIAPKNDASSIVAGSLPAPRQKQEASQPAGGQKDTASAVAAARAVSRGEKDVFNASGVSAFATHKGDVAMSFSASPTNFPQEAMGSSKLGSVQREITRKIDVALSKKRIVAAAANVTDAKGERDPSRVVPDSISNSPAQSLSSTGSQPVQVSNRFSYKPQQRVWLKPSDVKASTAGTSSRVDATSLLWDDDEAFSNDINAILWDNDDSPSAAATKTDDTEDYDNDTKQWFRDAMSHTFEEDSE